MQALILHNRLINEMSVIDYKNVLRFNPESEGKMYVSQPSHKAAEYSKSYFLNSTF